MYPPKESISIWRRTAITPSKDTQEWSTGSINMFTLLTLRFIFIIRWETRSSLTRQSWSFTLLSFYFSYFGLWIGWMEPHVQRETIQLFYILYHKSCTKCIRGGFEYLWCNMYSWFWSAIGRALFERSWVWFPGNTYTNAPWRHYELISPFISL